jgi:hypothetical protein
MGRDDKRLSNGLNEKVSNAEKNPAFNNPEMLGAIRYEIDQMVGAAQTLLQKRGGD